VLNHGVEQRMRINKQHIPDAIVSCEAISGGQQRVHTPEAQQIAARTALRCGNITEPRASDTSIGANADPITVRPVDAALRDAGPLGCLPRDECTLQQRARTPTL
jgi:hypothetical protein